MSAWLRCASRTRSLGSSGIREMMREASRHGAINLAPGIPELPTPQPITEAACSAIQRGANQYAITCGTAGLRRALAAKYATWYGLEVDADREITVTCGSTEALASLMLAVVEPGDDVLILQPFYENFVPEAVLAGARPVYLTLEPSAFRLERAALEAAITPRTRALIINSPNNPTGRVLDRAELEAVAAVAQDRDLLVITDEIYEHLCYDAAHQPLMTIEGMRERTATISGFSKVFRITGWRIGYVVAPAELTAALRKVHDVLTVGAAAPLQEACAAGLQVLGPGYYAEMVGELRARRDLLVASLRSAGFECAPPEGGYFVFADFSALSSEDDLTFARRMVREAGVAGVPGSAFYNAPERGRSFLRFAFCQNVAKLEEAGKRLRRFARQELLVAAG